MNNPRLAACVHGAPDVDAIEPAKALLDELTVALAEARGIPHEEALQYVAPIVRHLQQQYGGDEVYIPRPGRSHPVADIIAARRRGDDIRAICIRYSISRRTFYNLMQAHGHYVA